MLWRRLTTLTEAVAIVLVNAAVFAHETTLTPLERARFNLHYGVVPSVMVDAWTHFVSEPRWDLAPFFLPLVTANYLHADVGHIVGNTIFLWVFVNALAPVVGRALFVLIYLLGGIGAWVVYVHTNPMSEVATVGASGAIAALEGAYFALVIRWRLPQATVWPFPDLRVRPWALALLAAVSFVVDTGTFVRGTAERVAVGAHVGGFLSGAILAMVIASVRFEARNEEAPRRH